jgi:hypothetical protein
MQPQKKLLLFSSLGIAFGVSLWFCYLVGPTKASQEPQVSRRPILSKLPPIKSCVEHVKVVKAELVNQGDSQVASLELENTAYIGVTSVSIDTIVGKANAAVVKSAFSPDKEPLVIIPPGKTITMTIGNLSENSRIRIGSVLFSDGTEEGCRTSLETMRKLKESDTKKGGKP